MTRGLAGDAPHAARALLGDAPTITSAPKTSHVTARDPCAALHAAGGVDRDCESVPRRRRRQNHATRRGCARRLCGVGSRDTASLGVLPTARPKAAGLWATRLRHRSPAFAPLRFFTPTQLAFAGQTGEAPPGRCGGASTSLDHSTPTVVSAAYGRTRPSPTQPPGTHTPCCAPLPRKPRWRSAASVAARPAA
jgi:hypothetical protein